MPKQAGTNKAKQFFVTIGSFSWLKQTFALGWDKVKFVWATTDLKRPPKTTSVRSLAGVGAVLERDVIRDAIRVSIVDITPIMEFFSEQPNQPNSHTSTECCQACTAYF